MRLISSEIAGFALLVWFVVNLESCIFYCNPSVSGTVVDDFTGDLLDSVHVMVYDEGLFVHTFDTDSTGEIGAHGETSSTFLPRKCENTLTMTFERQGYQTMTEQISSEDKDFVVRMKR